MYNSHIYHDYMSSLCNIKKVVKDSEVDDVIQHNNNMLAL